jgi:hypothetical protein
MPYKLLLKYSHLGKREVTVKGDRKYSLKMMAFERGNIYTEKAHSK